MLFIVYMAISNSLAALRKEKSCQYADDVEASQNFICAIAVLYLFRNFSIFSRFNPLLVSFIVFSCCRVDYTAPYLDCFQRTLQVLIFFLLNLVKICTCERLNILTFCLIFYVVFWFSKKVVQLDSFP